MKKEDLTIKCIVTEGFTLERFDKIRIVKRANIEKYGRLYVNDEFMCDEKMAKYLTGGNSKKKTVVKIIEIKKVEK